MLTQKQQIELENYADSTLTIRGLRYIIHMYKPLEYTSGFHRSVKKTLPGVIEDLRLLLSVIPRFVKDSDAVPDDYLFVLRLLIEKWKSEKDSHVFSDSDGDIQLILDAIASTKTYQSLYQNKISGQEKATGESSTANSDSSQNLCDQLQNIQQDITKRSGIIEERNKHTLHALEFLWRLKEEKYQTVDRVYRLCMRQYPHSNTKGPVFIEIPNPRYYSDKKCKFAVHTQYYSDLTAIHDMLDRLILNYIGAYRTAVQHGQPSGMVNSVSIAECIEGTLSSSIQYAENLFVKELISFDFSIKTYGAEAVKFCEHMRMPLTIENVTRVIWKFHREFTYSDDTGERKKAKQEQIACYCQDILCYESDADYQERIRVPRERFLLAAVPSPFKLG